jgi:hypothetical protein
LYSSNKSSKELFKIYSIENEISKESFKEMIVTFSKGVRFSEFLLETLFGQITHPNRTIKFEEFEEEFL